MRAEMDTWFLKYSFVLLEENELLLEKNIRLYHNAFEKKSPQIQLSSLFHCSPSALELLEENELWTLFHFCASRGCAATSKYGSLRDICVDRACLRTATTSLTCMSIVIRSVNLLGCNCLIVTKTFLKNISNQTANSIYSPESTNDSVKISLRQEEVWQVEIETKCAVIRRIEGIFNWMLKNTRLGS